MPLSVPKNSVVAQDWKIYGSHCDCVAKIIAATIGQGVLPQFDRETAAAAVEFYIEQTDANDSYADSAGSDGGAPTTKRAPAAVNSRRVGSAEIIGPSSHLAGPSQSSADEGAVSAAEGSGAEDDRAIAAAERQRITLLRRVGIAMGREEHEIVEAIDDGSDVAVVCDRWTQNMPAERGQESWRDDE